MNETYTANDKRPKTNTTKINTTQVTIENDIIYTLRLWINQYVPLVTVIILCIFQFQLNFSHGENRRKQTKLCFWRHINDWRIGISERKWKERVNKSTYWRHCGNQHVGCKGREQKIMTLPMLLYMWHNSFVPHSNNCLKWNNNHPDKWNSVLKNKLVSFTCSIKCYKIKKYI